MKVLLINPPTLKKEVWVREGRCQQFDIWGASFPPLSLAYIAGQIKDISEPLIIDSGPADLDLENTLKTIKKFNPNLIIISTATPTINNDLEWFASKIKKEKPNIQIAAIGIHVTALPQITMESFSHLDFIIMGEPEITAKKLIDALKHNQKLNEISGLVYRDKNKIITNEQRKFTEDIDNLSFPYWPGINFKNYKMPIINKPFNLITFARGCPFSCKFCVAHVYYGKIIRRRRPEKIIEEIKQNIKMGIKDFLFWTEFITSDYNYLKNFLNLLRIEGLHRKIRWVSNSRVDFADYEIFKEMKRAGCWQIALGLEFGNNEILKLSWKGANATVEQGRKAIEMAHGAGIVADGHFILGYPGETEKTMQETIDFACSLPLTFAHFYAATPFPGSTLYKEALENNWLIEPNWRKTSQDIYNLNTADLTKKTVEKYINKAYKKFYLRPKTIWNIAMIAKTPLQFLNTVKLGIKLLSDVLRKQNANANK